MKPSTYPLLDGLVDLACRDGVDIRPTLLRVLTDLYVQKPAHSADEEAQYVELALGLIEAVDAPTRTAVVASLSNYPGAPAVILRKLGVAESATAAAASSASRPNTDNHVEEFFAASSGERRIILGNLDIADKAPPRRPVPISSEVVRRLETAALQHNTGEFSRTLERALGISRALAERVTRDPSGEAIVVAAKALGMKAAVLQRVLLFLNPAIGQSVERVHNLSRFFEELGPEAAERMLAIWQKASAQAKPAHEAAYWDDERRGARPLSSPQRQKTAGTGAQPATRFKSGER